MDKALFDEMAELEDRHWWFRARSEITMALLGKYLPRCGDDPRSGSGCAVVGDFGTGTGHMLAGLGKFGTAYGMESSRDALAYAVGKGVAEVREGALPWSVPYGESFFDAILMQTCSNTFPRRWSRSERFAGASSRAVSRS